MMAPADEAVSRFRRSPGVEAPGYGAPSPYGAKTGSPEGAWFV